MSVGKSEDFFYFCKGEKAEIQLMDEPEVSKNGKVYIGEHVKGHVWKDHTGKWTYGMCDGTSTCMHCQAGRNIVNKYKVRVKVFWQEGGAVGFNEVPGGRKANLIEDRYRWDGKEFILDMQASLAMKISDVYQQMVGSGLITHEDFIRGHFVVEKYEYPQKPNYFGVQFIAPSKVEADAAPKTVAPEPPTPPTKMAPRDAFDEVFGDDLDFKGTHDAGPVEPAEAPKPKITLTPTQVRVAKRGRLAYESSPLNGEERVEQLRGFLRGSGMTTYETEYVIERIENGDTFGE